MDHRLPNRMAKYQKPRGRPSVFADELAPEPPPPPPEELPDGKPCPCGKPRTWLKVYSVKREPGVIVRLAVCRGCGRSHRIVLPD